MSCGKCIVCNAATTNSIWLCENCDANEFKDAVQPKVKIDEAIINQKPLPCPICDSNELHIDTKGMQAWVACLDCGYEITSGAQDKSLSIAFHNAAKVAIEYAKKKLIANEEVEDDHE